MWGLKNLVIYIQLFGWITCCGPGFFGRGFSYHYEKSVPYDYYKIENDPKQVKSDIVTQDNLFSWLNLKNLVRFKLWTRKNPRLAHEVKFNDVESLETSSFDARRLTKILIHGFADTATEKSITYYLLDLKDAYLSLADLNVFVMDHSLFTMPLFYYSGFPEIASDRLAEFLSFLVEHGGASLDSVHLVGFSLGAHVAGLAGHALGGKVSRITGLDPAGPSFRFVDNEFRLDSSDAKFVDIIHTNGGSTLFYGGHLGHSLPLGHVDVFPNGGERQIGCPLTEVLIYETLECSHGRSVRFYTESITSPLAFPACRCETLRQFVRGECDCEEKDIGYMGEHMSHKARGKYQLITRAHKPFGHGPQMNLSLPDVPQFKMEEITSLNETLYRDVSDKKELAKRHISENLTLFQSRPARLVYNNKELTINYTNTFNPIFYPNDDIVNLCMEVLRAVNDSEKIMSTE